MDTTITNRKTSSRKEWLAARTALLEREKEHTRMGDELAQQRRELPWLAVEKHYTLQTALWGGSQKPVCSKHILLF